MNEKYFSICVRCVLKTVSICGYLAISTFAAEPVEFAIEIQPLLARRCFACHGPDKKESGLQLNLRDSMVGVAESGKQAVVPKSAERSELVRRISSADESERMPPEGKRLTEAEIDLVARWIDEGANVTPHWSFQPVRAQIPPAVATGEWLNHPLDAFVLKRLESHGLKPAGEASAEELVRRVYFDTIGLPPAPEVVRELVASWSESTYQKLVDRLLADPAMGDRWARNWLDVVRYAETNSFERDGVKPNAWKYRDYVVASMNSDKPYDRFIREQLAGDELDEVTPETLTATGFYRLGIWDDEPADPLLARFDEYDDVITTTSQGLLGLTFNCARCHDHKIDPILQRDYYSLLLFFRDVTSYALRNDQKSNSQISLAPPSVVQQHEEVASNIKKLSRDIKKIEQDGIAKMPASDQRATEGPERERVLREKLQPYLEPEVWEGYSSLKERLRKFESEYKKLPPVEMVLGLAKCDPDPAVTHIFARGNPHSPGAEVSPAFPQLLGGGSPQLAAPRAEAKTAGRRRVLADWIASPDNWMTSRVIVNRIWQHYFGRGIVRSTNNFGLMGDRPTHPEILDFLAAELVDHEWSLKAIHRQILMSKSYRMNSSSRPEELAKDPDNSLLWRQSVRRLSAEQLRDAVLAVTGQLNEQRFGESFFPTLSAEVLASQSRPGSGWGNSSPSDQARRSVYIHIKRSLPVPMMSAFDFPETDISCEARFLTTQPGQALGMLNGDWMQRQAANLVGRARREVGEDLRQQAARCLELALSRPANPADVQDLIDLAERLKTTHSLNEQAARHAMAVAVLNLNEFIYLD